MQISATHVLEFICEEAGEFFNEKFTTKGAGTIQTAPEWLSRHSYYELVKKAKQVTEPGLTASAPEDPLLAEYKANKEAFEAYMRLQAQPAGSHETHDPSELTLKPEVGEDGLVSTDPAGDDTASNDSDKGVDDGTLDVQSLAAKLNLGIRKTLELLKQGYGSEAKKGSDLLTKEVFEAALAATNSAT